MNNKWIKIILIASSADGLAETWGDFLRSLVLLGYGYLVPKFIQAGQENPR